MLNLLEKDLDLLDVDSLLCLDQLKNAQIVSLLKSLGIKQMEPGEIIENHILKVFGDKSLLQPRLDAVINEEAKSMSSKDYINILVLYLIYLNENYQFIQYNINKVRDLLVIKTSKGYRKIMNINEVSGEGTSDGIKKETIFLTKTYGNRYDLKAILGSYSNWCLVDSVITFFKFNCISQL